MGIASLVLTVIDCSRGQMADFSPLLKCRDFDKIQEWSVENQQNFPPVWDWHPRKKKPGKGDEEI